MTDRETLIAMFDRAGVVWEDNRPASNYEYGASHDPGPGWTGVSVAENGPSPANEGYPYFYTLFTFDENGALKSVGAWE